VVVLNWLEQLRGTGAAALRDGELAAVKGAVAAPGTRHSGSLTLLLIVA
jgi:hypothetical protein